MLFQVFLIQKLRHQRGISQNQAPHCLIYYLTGKELKFGGPKQLNHIPSKLSVV